VQRQEGGAQFRRSAFRWNAKWHARKRPNGTRGARATHVLPDKRRLKARYHRTEKRNAYVAVIQGRNLRYSADAHAERVNANYDQPCCAEVVTKFRLHVCAPTQMSAYASERGAQRQSVASYARSNDRHVASSRERLPVSTAGYVAYV